MGKVNHIKRIFISYSIEDKKIALCIAKTIKRKGFNVWLASLSIRPGDNLVEVINSELRSCDIFILVWSLHAKKSHWVTIEWQSSIMENKKIIPILIDNTPLPTLLKSINHIQFRDYHNDHKKLLDCLRN